MYVEFPSCWMRNRKILIRGDFRVYGLLMGMFKKLKKKKIPSRSGVILGRDPPLCKKKKKETNGMR